LTLYLDTALLIAAVVKEPTTPVVQKWLESNGAGGFATSRWALTEASSALALKVRTGDLTHEQRLATLMMFRSLVGTMELVAIQQADFEAAASLVDRETVTLKSGDALHLAVATRLNMPLRTLDRRFVAGAKSTGCDVLVATDQ